MTKILPALALLVVAACRAEFEPDPVGPLPPPPPPPAATIPFRVGSIEPDEGRAVVAGNFGDVIVASWYAASVDFDPGPGAVIRPSFGSQDLAVASYETDGTLRWVFTYGGSGADIPFAMAATADGGVVVTGHSRGGGTCGGRTLVTNGDRDILLLKLSSAGTCEWGHLIGSTLEDEGRAVAVEAGGTIVVAGLFRGTVDFDPGPGALLVPSRGGSDAFLARFAADGSFLEVVQGGGLEDDAFTALARAANGELSVGGSFAGTATFGSALAPVILQAQGPSDAVLARYSTLFGLRWAQALSATGSVTLGALATEPDGSVVAAGTFSGALDADPGVGGVILQSDGGTDVWIARYDGGSGVWSGLARRVGGLENEGVTGLLRSPNGDLTLSGWFQGTVDFDPGAGAFLVTARGTVGAGDAYLLTLDALGGYRWATPIGGPSTGEDALTIAWGIARVGGGQLWAVGRFAGRVDFDPGPEATELQSLGATDQFVSRYSAETGALVP